MARENSTGEPWSEFYRPKTLKECILPDRLKNKLQDFVDMGSVPNLLLHGSAGTGKTTSALAMCDEMGIDYLYINASLEGNIDTLRVRITQFASSKSMLQSGRKMVILDEGDYMSKAKFQPALRGFMQDYSKNCGFIITCNYKQKILEPLRSRCINIDFTFKKEEYKDLMMQFLLRVNDILDLENIKYDQKVIAGVIKFYFPDFRRVLNELQGYATSGEIDTGILSVLSDSRLTELLVLLKEKDWTGMRQWVTTNSDIDAISLYFKLFQACDLYLEPDSRPQLSLILREGERDDSMVVNKEINTIATLTYMMRDLEFKK